MHPGIEQYDFDSGTASINGTGKAKGVNDFIFESEPFNNKLGIHMSWGLKCLSHTILFIVKSRPKLELH